MRNLLWYVPAAALEIAGCYALWLWLRLGRSALWVLPAVASLLLFGFMLTRIQVGFAGRAFAAYGGVYIVASLVWLSMIERVRATRFDILEALLCLGGATIIFLGARLRAG
jgi:small multidrug resistance family-3 protein